MTRNRFSNYISWLFFPARFLFPEIAARQDSKSDQSPTVIDVPGWECLELKTDPNELAAFNRQVGDTYLGGSGNAFLVPLFGRQSAFTLDGQDHRLARKLISQAISKPCVDRVMAHMPHFLALELAAAPLHSRLQVGRVMRRVTLRAMCLTILGSTDEALFTNLLRRLESATGFFANIVSYNRAFWYPRGRWSVGAEVARRKRRIDDIILQVIADRREQLQPHGGKAPYRHDLLGHLLSEQSAHGYSDQFIRDNLVSTLAAGYDTTAAAMTWMLYWLSKDDRSRQLLHRHFRTGSQEYEPFAEAFVSEAMRYCPPLEILPRRPVASSGATDPSSSNQATLVCPCPHQVHHSRQVYGDPEAFRPERFIDNKYSPTEYFPFGLGNRLCLGVILAPKMLKATLDWVIAQERFPQFDKKKFLPIRRNVSLWPSIYNKATITKI